MLASALPKLTITYTLPKLAGKLPANIEGRWQTFIAGVRKHELVHCDFIKEMVGPSSRHRGPHRCRRSPMPQDKSEMTKRLGEISRTQRQKSRDFDRAELSDGGNVHQLILNLVNGGLMRVANPFEASRFRLWPKGKHFCAKVSCCRACLRIVSMQRKREPA